MNLLQRFVNRFRPQPLLIRAELLDRRVAFAVH